MLYARIQHGQEAAYCRVEGDRAIRLAGDLFGTWHETDQSLALADVLSGPRPAVDPALHERLRRHFDDDQILDLGMCVGFVTGWQRFIEAFGIRPDSWTEAMPLPWHEEAL